MEFFYPLLLRKCLMSRTYTSHYTVVHVHFEVVLPSELDLSFRTRCGEQCCWGEGKLIFLNLSVTKFPVGGPTYNLFFPVKLALLVYFCRCTHRKNIPVGYSSARKIQFLVVLGGLFVSCLLFIVTHVIDLQRPVE